MTEINVINLVDVMLTLLIIFILVAPAIKEGIELNLPEATRAKEIKRESLMVELDKDGKLYLSNKRVTDFDALAESLAAHHAAKPEDGVMLRADEAVKFGEVAKIVDAIKSADIERVGLILRKVSAREYE